MGFNQVDTYLNDPLLPVVTDPQAVEMPVQFAASQNLTKGTVMAQNSVSGLWVPYVNAGANGTGTPRGFLKDTITVDANGKVSFSNVTPEKEGQVYDTATIYITGVFKRGELGANFDAGAQTALGRWLTGNSATQAVANDQFYLR